MSELATEAVDFEISDEGSIWLFDARTPEAEDWWLENVEEGMTYCGKSVVEWRMAAPLVDGIIAEGFRITFN